MGKYFQSFAPNLSGNSWKALHKVLLNGFSSEREVIRKSSLNALELVLKSKSSNISFLNDVLCSGLPLALGDPCSSVRIAAALCVSHLCDSDWSSIPPSTRRTFCKTVVVALDDRMTTVVNAVLRAVGSMSLLPTFKTSEFLGMVLPNLILTVKADHVLVR